MNIKSLLLGSAAAFVAITGARAADAVVVAEPEPVDYVRVCDVYGKGFYYIPGTETCLSVGGYVRFQYNVAGDPARNLEGDDYQAGSSVRARLNFDAREETELGTLRAFARVQAQNNTVSQPDSALGASYVMDQAYIQLGGLLVGYRDSLWTSGVGGLEDGLLTDTDLVVGDINTNQISYTFAANGFSASLGLEDDRTGDIVPDVHAKLVYSGAWGGAYLSAVYDETFNINDVPGTVQINGVNVTLAGVYPTLLQDGNNDAFALKGGVLLKNLIAPESQLKIEGHYAFDPTIYAALTGIDTVSTLSNSQFTNAGIPLILEWAAGAGYAQAFGKLGIAVSGQYGKTFDATLFNTRTGLTTVRDGEYWAAVANVGYQITNNFATLGEVSYKNVDFGGPVGDLDQVSGFIRLQRDF
ncbi:porin [Aureimonas ureilytica]|uniref:Porin n=1 Tax=Aureimonas ureilytica TaxID=401562 RepID=A0A175R304_9HYPH|nr:porin [Aureimonas ureilytica]KTQ85313.1 porin [Aureimonas ureilytica]KTR04930.1 porin [Aureimonas ureilytica]